MLVVPQLLDPLSDRLRNLPRLAQVLPTGLPLVVPMLLVGKTVQKVLEQIIDDPIQYIGMTFVILAGPSFALASLELYGRAGVTAEIDWTGRVAPVLVTVLWVAALLGTFNDRLWLLALLLIPALLWWLRALAEVRARPAPAG